jgi:predicted nucleic acid-binding protein
LSSTFAFLHDGIILDACCLINLCETGRMSDILASLRIPVFVADYVKDTEVLRCDLQPFIDHGLLSVASPETEIEELTYVNFAVSLDDGEAITGALALHRGWAIGTDERKARKVFAVAAPHLQLLSTPELIKYWVDVINPSLKELRDALRDVGDRARYQPDVQHPLYKWWQEKLS